MDITKKIKNDFLSTYRYKFEDLTDLNEIKIVIPPRPGGKSQLGIDTNLLYNSLPSKSQSFHSFKIAPISGEGMRDLRRQDVIVSGFSELTEKRWRADIKNGEITLTLQKVPIKVFKKNIDKYITDLKKIMKFVNTQPKN